VFGEAHLRRVLKNYASYYNQVRTHLALDKNAPEFRHPRRIGNILELPLLGGLYHHYVRICFLVGTTETAYTKASALKKRHKLPAFAKR
jgi:hypothetical protein